MKDKLLTSPSSRLAGLPLAGAQVIRVAFRLGVLVAEVSQNLQPRQISENGPKESWAYVVPNVAASDVQKELDAIHVTEVREIVTDTYRVSLLTF